MVKNHAVQHHSRVNLGRIFRSLWSVVLEVRYLVVVAEYSQFPQETHVLDVDLAKVFYGGTCIGIIRVTLGYIMQICDKIAFIITWVGVRWRSSTLI